MAHPDKAEKISITLPPDMLNAIKEKVQTGTYGSTSEVIREAMRLWQRKEEEYQARLALISERLEHSANSGQALPLDEAFEQIGKLHQQHMNTENNEAL